MQTSFKAFSIRLPSPAKLVRRKFPIASEDEEVSGLEIPRLFTLNFGKTWRATVDPKLLSSLIASIVLYGLAAFLANEWLYLLACAMIIAVIIGAVSPLVLLKCVAVDCWVPEHGIASEESTISVLIRAAKWLGSLKYLVPLNALRARIILARRCVTGFEPHRDLGEQAIFLSSAGQATTLSMSAPHLARGVYKMSHVTLCTSFPFGLVWWTRKAVPKQAGIGPDTIVVLPRVCSLRGTFLLQVRGILSSMGMAFSETLAWSQSTSVRGLREFRVGDSLRHIHWASSARASKLLVREFDSETLPVFDLYMDLTARWASREQFELAVCLAHSLVQFGYERDMCPELFLRPQIDHESMIPFMEDLPLALPPLEMLSEILARVEPMFTASATPEVTARRPLLALVPANELAAKMGPGGESVAPVQLISLGTSGIPQTSKISGEVVATIFSDKDLEAL